ncbi:MAG: response regulator [Burkholderiaceae bacterium]
MSDNFMVGVTIDRSRHTVLVVDDNPATRYATSRVLRAADFQTVEAGSGEEALAKAQGDVSAVVLDVNLPDIDGFEVCQRLRAQAKTAILPVIHLSATYVEDRHKVAGLNAGADAYITHPAEPTVLVATVQALVRARMAEDLLRRSEAKFRAIYSQARSGIALIDSQGRFVDANPALLKMLKRSAAEMAGQPVSAFAPDQWKQFLDDKTISGDNDSPSWQESIALYSADGDLVHVEWSMSPHVEPGLRIAIVSDVSDRVQLEQRRQEVLEREHAARVTAERQNQTKDDFIAVLSHELRNPLNAMMMAVHVLLHKGVPPDIEAGLSVVKRNAKTQARIISDILDVARLNSGKLALKCELADAAALVHSSIDGMKLALEAKQLTLDLDIGAPCLTAWIDPTRFQQVFWNILGNAIKFSAPGGTIEVALSQDAELLTLTVRDHGIGIEADFIDTIFDKFTQGVSPRNSAHAGLGLGMPIVKHLVELHGGTVQVTSDGPGLGTTVRVRMPSLQDAVVTAPGALDDGQADPASALQGLYILVVEDDAQASEMLSLILRARGARVAVAASYDAALAALDQEAPSLLISDIGLGGKDGYELMREVRRRERASRQTTALVSIALTAFGRPQDRDLALEAGFNAHFAKPLDPQLFLSSLIHLSAGRQA